uniref:NADH dehydrogenase [ubiquinone] 1 alpha subcomplex assembly factor 3 n=1 Tax=Tetraselmis sp. GSL018 TaxID=582737 RepID=A0A061RLC2_9CHLO
MLMLRAPKLLVLERLFEGLQPLLAHTRQAPSNWEKRLFSKLPQQIPLSENALDTYFVDRGKVSSWTMQKRFPTTKGICNALTNTGIPKTPLSRRDASNTADFDLIEVNAHLTRIDGFYPGGFTVNNVDMPGAVQLHGSLSLLWKSPESPAKLKISDFALLELVKPVPDIVIIGTGPSLAPISEELRQELRKHANSVEVLDTANAASTFNILTQDGREVVGYFFPA